MTYLIFFFYAAAMAIWFYTRYEKACQVVVPDGQIAWDGEAIYHPGTYQIPFNFQLIDTGDRITAFGVDVLGLVSEIHVATDETGYDTTTSETPQGPISASKNFGKNISQLTTTKTRDAYKYRYIIVWRPNLARIRQYVNAGTIPLRFAELLRTIPDLNIYNYADTLGIEIVRWDTPPKKEGGSGSVQLGDDVEIEY